MKIERFLSQEDAATLSRIAENLLRVRDVDYNCAEKLIDLIATSVLQPKDCPRSDFVTLNSEVTYRAVGTRTMESIVLVCPHDANETLARVSILAPLAMALIGRVIGSIVEISVPINQIRFVEIVDFQPAHATSYYPGNAALL
ncbi:GreA/GreB family elongation factor [Noviherbaspirillum sp.]|uniref:GreA/GreB family elongation factor n=1 Tax=Noviherbaspirillum sp. TaxID=1926288 RepID=UPI002FE20CB7